MWQKGKGYSGLCERWQTDGTSDGKRYEWRKMIDAVKALGRPLTDEEAEQYRVK